MAFVMWERMASPVWGEGAEDLWEEQKRVNEDVEARAKAEARRYRAKRQEGMEKDFGKYKEEQAKQMVALEGTIILARSRG